MKINLHGGASLTLEVRLKKIVLQFDTCHYNRHCPHLKIFFLPYTAGVYSLRHTFLVNLREMSAMMFNTLRHPLSWVVLITFLIAIPVSARAEEDPDDPNAKTNTQDTQDRVLKPKSTKPSQRNLEHRKFVTDHPDRSDAGIFHVAFAAGGNFYVEPEVNSQTKTPTGNYFKDFGFQGGVYFDYDYSELPENIPLALRGFFGYKYILSSVHVFSFDGMVRRMFELSENTRFGLGLGGSAAVWYRVQQDATATSPASSEEIIFLPSFLIGAGFEFNPFMVDFKWLINRFGQDSTITGFELYFGFRL
jgi:hypothetical protein